MIRDLFQLVKSDNVVVTDLNEGAVKVKVC